MAHERLRHLLETRLGALGRAALAWRTRGQAEALLARRGLTTAAATLALQLRHEVVRGPFAGMRYPRRRGDIVHAAKLLGSYESELHGAIERLIARAPARVVNIGSGDGYYTVGLARRSAAAEVWAVDPDPLAQHACRATAALNGVAAGLRYAERLDASGLESVLRAPVPGPGGAPVTGRSLCVVDCEGYEDELLDPTRAPSLVRSDLLVETHDFARAGVTARLTARFAPTHDVEAIVVSVRETAGFPELSGLPERVGAGLLDEFRHMPQSWLVLTARTT